MSAREVSIVLVDAMAGLLGTAPDSLCVVTPVCLLRPILARAAAKEI